MGMMILPPIMVSLPFKLIFFVVVDGLRLVTGSLLPIWHLAKVTAGDLDYIRPSRMGRLGIGSWLGWEGGLAAPALLGHGSLPPCPSGGNQNVGHCYYPPRKFRCPRRHRKFRNGCQ